MEDCHQVLLGNRCVSVAASDPWRIVFVNSPGVPGLQRLGAHQLIEDWLFMARKTPAGAAQWGEPGGFRMKRKVMAGQAQPCRRAPGCHLRGAEPFWGA